MFELVDEGCTGLDDHPVGLNVKVVLHSAV